MNSVLAFVFILRNAENYLNLSFEFAEKHVRLSRGVGFGAALVLAHLEHYHIGHRTIQIYFSHFYSIQLLSSLFSIILVACDEI